MARAKFEILDSANKLAMLAFDAVKTPDVSVDKFIGYVKYGKRNDFPQELVRFYNDHAEHSAIVQAKAKYLAGMGLKVKEQEQEIQGNAFLDRANRFESWNDLNKKITLDCELFNACYLQVIHDLQGNPIEYLHLQYCNCRLSECGTKLFYSDDWNAKQWEFKYKCYPLYNKGLTGSSFIRFKYYQPATSKLKGLYPLPSYKGCLTEIKSDIDISTFDANLVLNGFSAGTMVTFFNGEPTPEEKRAIKEKFASIHANPENAGSIVINYANKGDEAAKIEAINADDLSTKFEAIQKRYQSKILIGHNVTNPEIFGVKTEGSSLGNRVSIRESYELMLNTYTKPRQEDLLSFIQSICFQKTGQWIEFEIEQLDPIGFDLTNDVDLTQDERRKLKGYEPLTAPKVDANGVEIKESEVNNTLTNLTGRQFQGLMRIVTKFDNGKLSKESAIALMVSGFGLTKEDALTFLNENDNVEDATTKMSNQKKLDDVILSYFESLDTDSDLQLELINEEEVHLHSSKDAMKFEMAMEVKFANEIKRSSWLDKLLTGITGIIGTPTPSEVKDIAKESNPEFKTTEILTKYHYALKSDAPPLKEGGKSRDFCVKMLGLKDKNSRLDNKQKEFTFEQIDKARVAGLSNGFPELDNIWDFRGGYYNNPKTNSIDPFCRHIWKARTYKIVK